MKKNNTLNTFYWILSLGLLIFTIINQKYINYSYAVAKFILNLISILLAIYCLAITKQGANFYKYWLGSVAELKKVTWPNRKEVAQLTLAVVVMVLVTGLILWTVDSILIKLVACLLQRRW